MRIHDSVRMAFLNSLTDLFLSQPTIFSLPSSHPITLIVGRSTHSLTLFNSNTLRISPYNNIQIHIIVYLERLNYIITRITIIMSKSRRMTRRGYDQHRLSICYIRLLLLLFLLPRTMSLGYHWQLAAFLHHSRHSARYSTVQFLSRVLIGLLLRTCTVHF